MKSVDSPAPAAPSPATPASVSKPEPQQEAEKPAETVPPGMLIPLFERS